jgi:biopolymer transport protein ExbD
MPPCRGEKDVAISGPKGGGGVFWEINITPLTDIFLVLLIIFMVTTSVTIESAAHVDLPQAENTSPENKGVIVTYTAQHEIFVNSRDVPERELEPSLREALGKVDSKIVVFQGDRKVLLGDMVRILDVAKRAGAGTIAIAAQRTTGARTMTLSGTSGG